MLYYDKMSLSFSGWTNSFTLSSNLSCQETELLGQTSVKPGKTSMAHHW